MIMHLKITSVTVTIETKGIIKKGTDNNTNKVAGSLNPYEMRKIGLCISVNFFWRVLSM